MKYYRDNFHIVASDLNLKLENFLYKIDSLSIVKESSPSPSIRIDGSKIVFYDFSISNLKPTSENNEENQRIAFIQDIEANYNIPSRSIALLIHNNCFVWWNIEFHLSFEKMIKYYEKIKSMFVKTRIESSHVQSQAVRATKTTTLDLNLNGVLKFKISTSSDQSVTVEVDCLEVHSSFPGVKRMASRSVILYFDENPIVKGFPIHITHYPKEAAVEIFNRQQNSCGFAISDKQNSFLSIDVSTVEIQFPHDYDFATAFNEKLMGVVKWLKLYHKREDSRREKPIDPDISIKVDRLRFEIHDDPFEVKLRNNHLLLEDEYHEQQKRDETLQERINELKRTNLMLASSSADELHRALAKKNSDIYIQRSKMLKTNEGTAPLFTAVIEECDLKLIADSSFHKHQDILPKIKNLNSKAPIGNDIQFSTIWCRILSADFKNAEVSLRDFQMSMIGTKDLTIKGIVIGSEQVAVARARRLSSIYVGRNSNCQLVERSMTPMKFFHDLQLRCSLACYTHGPCWDPVLAQVSLSFDKIVSSSKDPSPPLPWWDKMRFICHGSAKMNCNQLSVALHASNNPYNQTELLELCLYRAFIEYTSGKIQIKGDFDGLLHTASKYDECRFVHIPNIDITCKLNWNCLGNSHDHFTVMPCAPDRVPDYSSHHNHDSYRSFRSQNLDMSINIETQFNSPTSSINPENMPSIKFYGSTIRWLENQKIIFFSPSKLTRRGKLFNNTRPRKLSFTRIFNHLDINISLNKFQILYWSSVSKRHGIHAIGGELTHSSKHSQELNASSNINDGLKHRQQPSWETVSMSSSLSKVEIWLYNLDFEDLDEFNEFDVQKDLKNRQFFLSFQRIAYSKEGPSNHGSSKNFYEENEDSLSNTASVEQLNCSSPIKEAEDQDPNHRMIIYDLKGAWTKENRDVVIGIYDAFIKNLQLKRNLSTEALKTIRPQNQNQNQQPQFMLSNPQQSSITTSSPPYRHQRHPSTASLILTNTASPVSTVANNRAVSMLHKLIADSENNPTVYTEESHSGVASDTHLYGVEACQLFDAVYLNCLLELVNSQVALCGTETSGYVIVSAAQTEIRQRIHVPVWKNRTLLSKTTWTGSLRSMQYFATVDNQSSSRQVFANESDIQWLELDNIDCSRDIFNDYLEIIRSGHKGSVINSVAGVQANDDDKSHTVRLQRIISRSNCLFYLAKHVNGVSEDLQHLIPPLPDDEIFIEPWDKEVGVDSFTLTHQDLDITTNSQQYAIVLDIINNLLLHVEPHKKDAFEQQERMRFRFQLSSDEDQREPISQLQNEVRKCVAYLKQLEKERYLVYRASIDDSLMSEVEQNYRKSLSSLSSEIQSYKEQLNTSSEQLAMMINCYKETLLGAHKAQEQEAASQQGTGAFFANVIKRNEICFKNASWRVIDSNDQLGLADTVLNNFLYSKVVKSDDSVEHTIELGNINVSNLLPNQHYTEVLQPTKLQANIPLDRQRALRIYCRELAPVGGIPVKEHLEVNVVPFTIEITLVFFQKMVKFFFPEKDAVDKEKTKKRQDASESQMSRLYIKRTKDRSGSDISVTPSGGGSSLSSHTNSLLVGHTNEGSRNLEDTISTMSTATINSNTSSGININQRRGDDIEKMRERASKNHTFVYVKIPGIPIRVSYKGKKQKNVTDLKNISLTLPTYEYHNATWTWLDLLMAVKNDSKHTVIKQALKQKMKIRPSALWSKSSNDHQAVANEQSSKEKHSIPVTDEEKARLLLGHYAKGWRIDIDPPRSNSDSASIDSEISR